MMTKERTIIYIEAAGYKHETAVEMTKNLPDEFDTEDTVMSDGLYDTIMEGEFETEYIAKSFVV